MVLHHHPVIVLWSGRVMLMHFSNKVVISKNEIETNDLLVTNMTREITIALWQLQPELNIEYAPKNSLSDDDFEGGLSGTQG